MTLEKRWQKWLTLAVFLGILGLFTYVGYQKLQPYMIYFTDYNQIRAWAAAGGWKGKILMVLALAFQVVVAVIPGGPMEIGALRHLACSIGDDVGLYCGLFFVPSFW